MARVRQRGTSPERRVREILRRLGVRFEPNVKSLPGSPDIFIVARRRAIFVHGCFWHRHKDCKAATMPKSNSQFWRSKFAANTSRDRRKARSLRAKGIGVWTVWECDLKDVNRRKALEGRLRRLLGVK